MPKEQRHHGPSAGAGQPGGGSRLLSPSASLRDPVSARRRLRPGGVTVWRAGGHGQGTPGAGEAQGTEAGRTARGWSGQDGLRGEGPCAPGVGGRQDSGSIAERGRGQAGLREGGQEGSPGTQEVEMRPGDRKGLRVSYRGRRRWNGRAGGDSRGREPGAGRGGGSVRCRRWEPGPTRGRPQGPWEPYEK